MVVPPVGCVAAAEYTSGLLGIQLLNRAGRMPRASASQAVDVGQCEPGKSGYRSKPTEIAPSVAMDKVNRRGKADLERQNEIRLAAILEQLPVAVTLFDRSGRFVICHGALRTVLGDVIPSQDSIEIRRWQVFNDDGQPLDPSEWPGPRALRGETIIPGLAGTYSAPDGRERWLRITAIPFSDDKGFVGGAALLQDIDLERRAQDSLRDEMEVRFVDALFRVIHSIYKENTDSEPRMSRSVISNNPGVSSRNIAIDLGDLTEREAEVLRLIAWGKSHKEIGAQLNISVKTVQFHRSGAMKKLHLRNRAEVVRYALGQRWLDECT